MEPRPRFRVKLVAGILATFLFIDFNQPVFAEKNQVIDIVFFPQVQEIPPVLSNLDLFIVDKGVQGARLAIKDNNTTGQFTGQQFNLKDVIIPVGGDIKEAFNRLIKEQYSFLVTGLLPHAFKQITEIAVQNPLLIMDAATIDDEFRNRDCQANVFHLLPSRAMRADALAQYMLKKRWRDWFLVVGPSAADKHYSDALKRSAKRFGMKIIAEKNWTHTFDARRTAQSDVPVFTQGVDYDVLVVADEQGLFGEYLSYRTWLPRPVIGTQGLLATSWHRTHEQWGAVQMQNRFKEHANRWKTEQDYAAYLAIRSIGEAATRTRSGEVEPIKSYLLGDEFALQGYKGKPLSFRKWNGQLRQPVLLAAARSLVTVAPIDGFLHPLTELDTLGYDQPETQCSRGKKQ